MVLWQHGTHKQTKDGNLTKKRFLRRRKQSTKQGRTPKQNVKQTGFRSIPSQNRVLPAVSCQGGNRKTNQRQKRYKTLDDATAGSHKYTSWFSRCTKQICIQLIYISLSLSLYIYIYIYVCLSLSLNKIKYVCIYIYILCIYTYMYTYI